MNPKPDSSSDAHDSRSGDLFGFLIHEFDFETEPKILTSDDTNLTNLTNLRKEMRDDTLPADYWSDNVGSWEDD